MASWTLYRREAGRQASVGIRQGTDVAQGLARLRVEVALAVSKIISDRAEIIQTELWVDLTGVNLPARASSRRLD